MSLDASNPSAEPAVPAEPDVMAGAEPISHAATDGAAGALVLHGFTGNPSSVRGVAEAFVGARKRAAAATAAVTTGFRMVSSPRACSGAPV